MKTKWQPHFTVVRSSKRKRYTFENRIITNETSPDPKTKADLVRFLFRLALRAQRADLESNRSGYHQITYEVL